MKNNINNKYQCNDVIEYEPKFDGKSSLSSGSKDPLPVVTVSIWGGKKQRSTIIDGLTCLWDIGYTNRMIKMRQTKPYNWNMSYNKVEHSTASGDVVKSKISPLISFSGT